MYTAHPIAVARTAPGPHGHLLWGNLLKLQRDPLNFLVEAMHQYGDVVRFRLLGSLYWHMFTHPDDIEHVLRANFNNYPKGTFAQKMTRLVTGEGLAASDGEEWLSKRRLLQPAFHRHRLTRLATTMTSATEAMLDDWDARSAAQQPYDIAAEMMRLTLRIVGETLFSIDISQAEDEIGKAMTVIVEHTGYRLTHPLSPPEAVPTNRNQRYQRASRKLDQVVLEIVTTRQRSGEDKGDLLSMLIEARDEETGAGMNADQLRAEVKTLMISGHETTAIALAWTWYLLSQHPEVEHRLHAELASVLGGRTPTFVDLPNLAYTRMVLEESLRIRPPAWITVRQAREDDTVRGYHIPADSVVVLSPYVVHRNPAIWPDPERFDPERFAPEQAAGRHKYAFIGFSGGPRLCIGSQFAMMEAQLLLATIAQRYRLTLAPSHSVVPELGATMRPRGGMPMLMQRRSS
jgi:cytochrome P450